jgi:hypothetical protein
MKQLFKKIFDLDPNEVEAFVKNLMVEQIKRNGGDDEYLKDYDIIVRWIVTDNSFYVFLDPKLKTEDYKHFYFNDEKELTAGEYFQLTYTHEHYEFPEVYGLMTGETTFVQIICGIGDFITDCEYIYKKETIHVAQLKDESYTILKWNEKTHKDESLPLPEDLQQIILEDRRNHLW